MNASCEPCKRRHLKCDRTRPLCGNCRKSRLKLNCHYRTTRFRQSILSLLADNVRSGSPSEVGSPSDDGHDVDQDQQASHKSTIAPETTIPQVSPDNDNDASVIHAQTTYSDSSCRQSNTQDASPADVLTAIATSPFHPPPLLWASSPDAVRSGSLIGQNGPEHHSPVTKSQKPITVTKTDSVLFLHYLKHAGVWLDIVSPSRSFSQEVPRRALQNPLLYYSCVAYSAHVLCLQGRGDQADADYYHNKAISILIPLLNPGTLSIAAEEDLFAAITILRMSEQFLEPHEDAQTHIYGAFSLLTSSKMKWLPDRVDMPGIAFWIFVRQTLRICFLSEQPCPFNLDIVSSDNFFTPASDEVWTNRMTFLLAKVCNACWSPPLSDDSQFRQEDLVSLEADINLWNRSLPDTFKPWYYRDVPSLAFPQIQYLTTWHAIAWQQYYTSKTMIAVYREKQQISSTYHESNRYRNSQILAPARLACGVIFSDKDIGTGVNGAHLAYWCGQFLMGRAEQYEILTWLESFMTESKWPNRTCIEHLQKQWAMVPDRDFHRNSPPLV